MRWLPLAVVVAVGCATTTRVVRLSPTKYEPRAADVPIQLYSSHLPSCPFEEIAVVSARPEYVFVTTNDVVDGLRHKARALGGDALVGVGFLQGDQSTVSGTVIRFKHDDCRQ